MSSSPPALPTLQLPSWLEELWNASSSNATVGQAALISLALAILAALIAHLLTKRRENERWANQNTLHALQRATDAFYKPRQHYGHLLRIDPLDLMLGTLDESSSPLTAPRDWTRLHEPFSGHTRHSSTFTCPRASTAGGFAPCRPLARRWPRNWTKRRMRLPSSLQRAYQDEEEP